MVCISCIDSSCPVWIVSLAIIGIIVVYTALAVAFTYLFAIIYSKGKSFNESNDNVKSMSIISGIFFPIAIPLVVIIYILYGIGTIIYNICNCATKQDLLELESRLNTKMNCVKKCDNFKEKIIVNPLKPFKVGDLITGKKGNPDEYKHLNEGSICRVKSIDDNGSMKLILVDHKDFSKHSEVIGNEFKAPARNFITYKKK
jgi:hypothetical protein